jgi:hypothetical protein
MFAKRESWSRDIGGSEKMVVIPETLGRSGVFCLMLYILQSRFLATAAASGHEVVSDVEPKNTKSSASMALNMPPGIIDIHVV